MCADAASSSPPPTTAPCSTAITGTRPSWIWSNAACQVREWRMRLGDVALLQLGEIEAGAEVLALAADHDRAHVVGKVDEGGVQLRHQRVVDGVALGRAIQAHVQHRAARLDAEQVERSEGGRQRRGGASGGMR